MKYLFLVIISFFSLFSVSQNSLKPVTWDVEYREISKSDGELVFTAHIEPKWHIYSQRPTDLGPIPTSFTVTPNSNYELIGKVEEMEAHEEFVAAFDAKVFVFSGKAVFKQRIKRKTTNNFIIDTQLEFMTCNDAQCLPPVLVKNTVKVP